MSNPISSQIRTGTIGELLVQVRLLQFGVQAAPPLKDSGNDLIAIRGEVFRTIQVKTSTTGIPTLANLPAHFHILALVSLVGEDHDISLDKSNVFLVPRNQIGAIKKGNGAIDQFRISKTLVGNLFQNATHNSSRQVELAH